MPQGFLLSGDAETMAAMTPDRVEMLREMVGGFGLSLTVQRPIETPVYAGKEDFLRLADETDLTRRAATMAWNAIVSTHRWGVGNDIEPPLRPVMVQPEGHTEPVADVRAIKARLATLSRYEYGSHVFARAGKSNKAVFTELVARLIETDEQ
jgi:hypothetical protein